jgi:hypothetical protein
MKITAASDWQSVEQELNQLIRTVNYNPDLVKMKRNLDSMVTELSRQEVVARRTKNSRYLQPQLDSINLAINNIEKWILMLQLTQ